MKRLSLSPPIPVGCGEEGNNFFILGLKERLISLLRTFGEKESQFLDAIGIMTRGQYSDVLVLLQITFIYPFDTCVNWWCKCFENRHVEQIGSCSYDG